MIKSNLVKFNIGERCFLDDSKNNTFYYVKFNEECECKKTATYEVKIGKKNYFVIYHPNIIHTIRAKGRSTILAKQTFPDNLELKESCDLIINSLPAIQKEGEKVLKSNALNNHTL